jgi:hypothetical protein
MIHLQDRRLGRREVQLKTIPAGLGDSQDDVPAALGHEAEDTRELQAGSLPGNEVPQIARRLE